MYIYVFIIIILQGDAVNRYQPMHNKRKEKGKKKKKNPKAWKYQKISTTVLPGLREQAELSFLIGANYSPFSAVSQTVCFKGKICGAPSA